MELVQANDKYKFRVEVWESNKGKPGFCAWALWIAVPELETWYKLDGSHRNFPLSPDNAERIARDEFDRALAGHYDWRIENAVGVAPLGTWEGIIPEPDLPTDDDDIEYDDIPPSKPIESFRVRVKAVRVEYVKATRPLDDYDDYQDGDTEPNAAEYDCGYATIAGACVFANTDHCEGCPYRVAIGDVAR